MSTSSRILVVDDNPTNRKILVSALGKTGYDMREASDGFGAVECALAWRPHLVLLDVSMPGRDGFEACEILKSRAETAATPVIFLTALRGTAEIERGFAVGGCDYVAKPFHLGELKARVAVHLRLCQLEVELKDAHVELLQAQKLESIGQLAAGIAHEINTPTQFVGDNMRFLQDALAKLTPILVQARALAAAVRAGEPTTEPAEALEQSFERVRLDFLRKEIPCAIQESIVGLARVSTIVRAMKEFSHPSAKAKEPLDVNHLVETTVTVARSEWKYVADLKLDLAPDLPRVPGLPGELGQVVLNLVVNAAHAIADVVDGGREKGRITIRTRQAGEHVEITISDTGTGIPAEIRERLFDPFFTTKEVGKGTGQGLAIAHRVVVKQHGGTLDAESAPGAGATFRVRLPLEESAEAAA